MLLIGQCDSPFVRRVAVTLRLYGLAYDHAAWSTFGDADKIDRYNPLRRVPTLVLDDGRPLAESNAILWYLGDGTQYAPTDPYERAQVLQWQFFEQYQVEPSLAVVRFLIAFSGQADKHAQKIEEQTANGYIALDAMERHLDGRDFLVGGQYTLADISLYAYTHVAPEGEFDLERYPAIRAWIDRVAAQPGHITIDA